MQRSQSENWAELFNKLKYESIQYDSNFLRYKPDTIAAWPVDLMLVDDATFSKLLDDKIKNDLGGVV